MNNNRCFVLLTDFTSGPGVSAKWLIVDSSNSTVSSNVGNATFDATVGDVLREIHDQVESLIVSSSGISSLEFFWLG